MGDLLKVLIVDLGVGNINSVRRVFEHIEVDAEIVKIPEKALNCDKLILPGVGAFDSGMEAIESGGWSDVLNHLAFDRRVPILGICLGMHLLCRGSEEGKRKGLGWIPADVVTFKLQDMNLKVPHMGWCVVAPTQANPLLPMGTDEQRFYHTHRYHAVCDSGANVVGISEYGYPFASAVRNENVYGVQFHPEKSHRYGMKLLRRFSDIEC